MDKETLNRLTQFLTTEHAALQAARSALVLEGNGRTASFLNTISAGVVALALVFNISQFGPGLPLFSLVLIPILGLIGISSYVRMTQLDLADYAYIRAINRIRHFYLQTAPEIEQFISFPAFDDESAYLLTRVNYTGLAWTVLSYPSTLILVINSVLAGALCSLLVTTLFRAQILPAAGLGVIVLLLVSVLQYRLGMKWFTAVRKDFQSHFPATEAQTVDNPSVEPVNVVRKRP